MTTPQDIIRPDVLAMTSYPVPHSTGLVKLDAMENPYRLPDDLARELGEHLAGVALNRYPAPRPASLLAKIKRAMNVPPACEVLLGNGSDELISMHVDGVREAGREGRSSSAGLRDVSDVGGVRASATSSACRSTRTSRSTPRH